MNKELEIASRELLASLERYSHLRFRFQADANFLALLGQAETLAADLRSKYVQSNEEKLRKDPSMHSTGEFCTALRVALEKAYPGQDCRAVMSAILYDMGVMSLDDNGAFHLSSLLERLVMREMGYEDHSSLDQIFSVLLQGVAGPVTLPPEIVDYLRLPFWGTWTLHVVPGDDDPENRHIFFVGNYRLAFRHSMGFEFHVNLSTPVPIHEAASYVLPELRRQVILLRRSYQD